MLSKEREEEFVSFFGNNCIIHSNSTLQTSKFLDIGDPITIQFNDLIGWADEGIKLGKNKVAFKYLNDALCLMPENSDLYFMLGDVVYDMDYRNSEKCIKYYRDAVKYSKSKIDPIHKLAFSLLDLSKQKLKKSEKILLEEEADELLVKASSNYKQAIINYPSSYKTYLNLGAVSFKNEDYNNALEMLDLSIELKNDIEECYFIKGEVLQQLNRDIEAIENFKKCLQLLKKNVFALVKISISYFKLGKIEEALKCLDDAIEIDGCYGDAYNFKGQMLEELFRKEEAFDMFEKCKEFKCKGEKLPKINEKANSCLNSNFNLSISKKSFTSPEISRSRERNRYGDHSPEPIMFSSLKNVLIDNDNIKENLVLTDEDQMFILDFLNKCDVKKDKLRFKFTLDYNSINKLIGMENMFAIITDGSIKIAFYIEKAIENRRYNYDCNSKVLIMNLNQKKANINTCQDQTGWIDYSQDDYGGCNYVGIGFIQDGKSYSIRIFDSVSYTSLFYYSSKITILNTVNIYAEVYQLE